MAFENHWCYLANYLIQESNQDDKAYNQALQRQKLTGTSSVVLWIKYGNVKLVKQSYFYYKVPLTKGNRMVITGKIYKADQHYRRATYIGWM